MGGVLATIALAVACGSVVLVWVAHGLGMMDKIKPDVPGHDLRLSSRVASHALASSSVKEYSCPDTSEGIFPPDTTSIK